MFINEKGSYLNSFLDDKLEIECIINGSKYDEFKQKITDSLKHRWITLRKNDKLDFMKKGARFIKDELTWGVFIPSCFCFNLGPT